MDVIGKISTGFRKLSHWIYGPVTLPVVSELGGRDPEWLELSRKFAAADEELAAAKQALSKACKRGDKVAVSAAVKNLEAARSAFALASNNLRIYENESAEAARDGFPWR